MTQPPPPDAQRRLPPARRPLWRTVVGVVLLALGAVSLIWRVASVVHLMLATEGAQAIGPAYLAGILTGSLLTIVLPIALGTMLLATGRKPRVQ